MRAIGSGGLSKTGRGDREGLSRLHCLLQNQKSEGPKKRFTVLIYLVHLWYPV